MMIITDIPQLDKRGLRHFGFTTGAIVALLFGLLLPWIFSHGLPIWPWVVALVLGVLATVFPKALNPVYKVWMRFGLVLGFINTRIIMFILFYVFFLPIGVIMKLLRVDPMARTFKSDTKSYRVESKARDKHHFERPY
jgi:predicted membrane protein